MHGDLVIESRRRAQARRPVVCPVYAYLRLLSRALSGGHYPIASQPLHLVISSSILRAIHVGRRRDAELVGEQQYERPLLAPALTELNREQADRVLTPLSRVVARNEVNADAKLAKLRSIVDP